MVDRHPLIFPFSPFSIFSPIASAGKAITNSNFIPELYESMWMRDEGAILKKDFST